MTIDKVTAPQYLFSEIDGVSFFLGRHRFWMTSSEATKFGSGLVNASLAKSGTPAPKLLPRDSNDLAVKV